MKRLIKFRAWDGFKMHNDFQFIKSGNESNGWIIFISDKQPLTSDWKNNPFFQMQLEIMQFTGIKDKNGKEIYEGDILLTETGKNMIVRWDKQCASFVVEREGWAFKHYFGEAFETTECEIIGNKFENHELL